MAQLPHVHLVIPYLLPGLNLYFGSCMKAGSLLVPSPQLSSVRKAHFAQQNAVGARQLEDTAAHLQPHLALAARRRDRAAAEQLGGPRLRSCRVGDRSQGLRGGGPRT